MNFDDLLGKLIPLFEQKLAFSMEMSKRAMSLEEKKEASRTDLEYRKLEALITNDKDKLKWEKEKLTTAIKGEYDLQVLKNSNLLDGKRLENLGAKEKQDLENIGKEKVAKIAAGSEEKKSYLTALGTILGHAREVSQTSVEGTTRTEKPTAEVGTVARSLMEQTGLAKPAAPGATSQGRNVAGEAEFAADVLRQHEKAGTPDAARNYLNALPRDTQQATMALLRSGNPPATPAVGAATVAPPAAPPTVARPPISEAPAAVQPATPAVEPVRPAVEPAAQVAPVAQQKRFATAGPLDSGGKTAFGGTPGGVLGEIWNRGSVKADKALEQRKMDEEEEKKRALRRARGLTVGGGF
jgi:hypothetical protein